MMSLVEYDSSDSDEEAPEITPASAASSTPTTPAPAPPPLPQPNENPVRSLSDTVPAPLSSNVPAPSSSNIPAPSSNTVPVPSLLPALDELPDAEFLLSSPQNEPRKRQSNGNGAAPSQHKFPRGPTQSSVAHVRNARAPTAGTLVPPQLTGRSNVVTEDINKLFVNRRRSSSG